MSKRILVVSAHPDDETLGCGGTLLKHRDAGDAVHWLVVTAPWAPKFDEDFMTRCKKQTADVAEAFGMASIHEAGLKAARLDAMPLDDVITPMRKVIETVAPDRIYVVYRGDVHSDHRVVFDAVWAAVKPFNAGSACAVLTYETISSTNMAPSIGKATFVPNAWCDITGHMARKIEIFRLYDTEIQAPPHPRSDAAIEALARFRGSAVGAEFAEAFMIVRQVW